MNEILGDEFCQKIIKFVKTNPIWSTKNGKKLQNVIKMNQNSVRKNMILRTKVCSKTIKRHPND